ncbi:MAG TPA: IS110 family transposase, partial [Stellaceae bacterium]
LIAAGKSPKVATVALMRKMLVTLNAMVRDNEAWKHAKPC